MLSNTEKISKDSRPIVLAVLSYTSTQVAMLAIRLAIEIGYPYLGCKMDTNEKIHRAVLLLLNKIDDDRVNILNYLYMEIQKALEAYAKLYGLDLALLSKNAAADHTAIDFYTAFIAETSLLDVTRWQNELYIFISSIVEMFGVLCELLIEGEIDLSDTHDHDGNWIKQDDGGYDIYITSEVEEYQLVARLSQFVALSLEKFHSINFSCPH